VQISNKFEEGGRQLLQIIQQKNLIFKYKDLFKQRGIIQKIKKGKKVGKKK